MTIEIGYTIDDKQGFASSARLEPHFHPRRAQVHDNKRLRKCPASIDYCSSAFDVYVPYDLCFSLIKSPEGNVGLSLNNEKTTLGEHGLKHCFELAEMHDGIVQINSHPFWTFISDDPNVRVVQLPSYGQTNPEPIRGEFDCYKWFRPITYAIKVEFDEEVFISSTSPIFQVKFFHPSETRFTLRECELTEEVKLHMKGAGLRGYNKKTKWHNVFDFAGKRRPKKVLQFTEWSQEI